ncbi:MULTISPECIES: hypothetical protein [unclassified Pseudomonas]|uniref:hypothetical protein n=1 Tax=unclassified Pseudomonas TaxID=196821 RepID=UPI00209765EC|nr:MULTISPECIES: hypothetical protein [unclassified Pseudomonas]MCO7518139.1 hypothetical protein [Pseudomonas sp. 1]MCO7541552.1 hypothetical protein [Pseudomonas sp. VA159-2]
MHEQHWMGGGDAEHDWPQREPDQRNDRARDPDTDPAIGEEQNRPGVPATDPESGA